MVVQQVDQKAGSSESLFRRQGEAFAAGFSFSGYERDHLYLNLANKTFLDIGGVSGVDSITDGRAGVFADLDNDGDTDIFLRAVHGPAHFLFRNNVGEANHFLRLLLQGTASGRDAYGAVVRAKTSAGIQTRIKSGGAGFLSQSDPRLLFGLGHDTRVEWVEVDWPSGARQRFNPLPANSAWLLVEADSRPRPIEERRLHLPEPLGEEQMRWKSVRLQRGQPLPPSPVLTLAGARTTLDKVVALGRPTLVNFWATWCLPCQKEMPELQSLSKTAGENGLRVIGISLDDEQTRDHMEPFLRRLGITYSIYLAEKPLVTQIFAGANAAVPFTLLVDAKGRVQEVFEGWSPAVRKRVEAALSSSSP